MRYLVIALLLLILVAGCTGNTAPTPTPAQTTKETPSVPTVEIIKKVWEDDDNPLYDMLDIYVKNNGLRTVNGRVMVKVYNQADTVTLDTDYGYFTNLVPGETTIVRVMIDTDVPEIEATGLYNIRVGKPEYY